MQEENEQLLTESDIDKQVIMENEKAISTLENEKLGEKNSDNKVKRIGGSSEGTESSVG